MNDNSSTVIRGLDNNPKNVVKWDYESHTESGKRFSKKMSYRKPRRMSRDYIEDCLNYENED